MGKDTTAKRLMWLLVALVVLLIGLVSLGHIVTFVAGYVVGSDPQNCRECPSTECNNGG